MLLNILGIHHYDNVIIVISMLGIITQLTIFVKTSKIVISRKKVQMKVNIQQYRTHGFFFTSNMALCGLLLFPKSLHQYRYSSKKTNLLLYICNNSYVNPVEVLWSNSTGSLENYWDCFEALR